MKLVVALQLCTGFYDVLFFLLLPCVSLGDWSASCCRSVLGYSIQVIGNDVSG